MELATKSPAVNAENADAEFAVDWGDLILKWTIVICASVSLLVMIVGLCLNLYRKIRLYYRYGSLWPVNCWFCNTSTKVAFALRNSWSCPSCQQYNGFSKDGGYNKRIQSQYLQVLNPPVVPRGQRKKGKAQEPVANGLCAQCNLNQELKVFHLASFVPTCETNFDNEIEDERNKLEKMYDLCGSCKKVLKAKLEKTINNIGKNDSLNTQNGVKQPRKGWFGKLLLLSPNPKQDEPADSEDDESQSQKSNSSKGTFYSTASSLSVDGTQACSMTLEEDLDEVTSLHRLNLGGSPRKPTFTSNFYPTPSMSLFSNYTRPSQHVQNNGVTAASSIWRNSPLVCNHNTLNTGLVFGRPATATPSVNSFNSQMKPHSFCQNDTSSNLYRSSSVASLFGGKSILAPSRLSSGFGSPGNLTLNNYGHYGTLSGWGVGLYYHNCFGPVPSPSMYYSSFGPGALFNPHLSRASSQSSGFISQGLHTPSPRPPMSSEGSRAASVLSGTNNSLFGGYPQEEHETHLHFRGSGNHTKKPATTTRMTRARSNEWSRFGPHRPMRPSAGTGSTERGSPRPRHAKEHYYSSDSEDDQDNLPKKTAKAKPKTPDRENRTSGLRTRTSVPRSPPVAASGSQDEEEPQASASHKTTKELYGHPLEIEVGRPYPDSHAWKRFCYYAFIVGSVLTNLIFLSWLIFRFEGPFLMKVANLCTFDNLQHLCFDSLHWVSRVFNNATSYVKNVF